MNFLFEDFNVVKYSTTITLLPSFSYTIRMLQNEHQEKFLIMSQTNTENISRFMISLLLFTNDSFTLTTSRTLVIARTPGSHLNILVYCHCV